MKKSINLHLKLNLLKNQIRLYLLNDEYNTFEHVINCLVAICDHSDLQAERYAFLPLQR